MPLAGIDREYAALQPAIDAAVRSVLASGRVSRGPAIARFERAWARWLGVRHVVLVHSGTTALAAALAAAGVRPGDEVVVPALTFPATAEAVLVLGAVPVVVDVAPDTLLLDAAAALRAVGPRTRAVVPVHLFGQPHPDLPRLARLLLRRRVALVEDACQSHGAAHPGARSLVLGAAAAFSFYPTKNLSTYGEAGAVATDDPRRAARVRAWRNHGLAEPGGRPGVGLNLWPGEIEAAILCVKLPHLRAWNARRRATARLYDRALAGHEELRPVANVAGNRHVYHQYVVRARDRDRWRARLAAAGIETGVHYPRALPDWPGLARHLRLAGDCAAARAAAAEVFSVPVHPWLTESERRRVAAALAGR